jgi:hypothetical protein
MSLLIMNTSNTSNAQRTPRDRVYGRLDQYFNITAPGAYITRTQFLPSPYTNPCTNPTNTPEDNWLAEDELAWDQRLQAKGSKKILTA